METVQKVKIFQQKHSFSLVNAMEICPTVAFFNSTWCSKE